MSEGTVCALALRRLDRRQRRAYNPHRALVRVVFRWFLNLCLGKRRDDMLEDSQVKMLMRMYDLEQSLAEMYALFAKKFPQHGDLWQRLVMEEQEHAEAVQKFYRLTYEKSVSFSEGPLRIGAVEAIIEYVKKNCEIAQRGLLTAAQALGISRDIEKSMIAKDIFKYFRVRVDFANLLQYLRDSSEDHARLVDEEIKRGAKSRLTWQP